MQFSETQGMILLTVMLAISILVIDRIAHPATIMDRAIGDAEHTVAQQRVDGDNAEYRRMLVEKGANRAAAPAGQSAGGLLGAAIGAGGGACPAIRAVVPIGRGGGLYRVTCAAGADGRAFTYRVHTRTGVAQPDDVPGA